MAKKVIIVIIVVILSVGLLAFCSKVEKNNQSNWTQSSKNLLKVKQMKRKTLKQKNLFQKRKKRKRK